MAKIERFVGCEYEVGVMLKGANEPIRHYGVTREPYLKSGCLHVSIQGRNTESEELFTWVYPTENVQSWNVSQRLKLEDVA